MLPADGRQGFTVLELSVALAVGGIVILAAWTMVDRVARTSAEIVAFAKETDREANSDRLLRSLLEGVEVRTDSLARFVGGERSMRFITRCDMPGGWQEPCAAGLAIERVDAEPALHVVFAERIIVLKPAVGRAYFRYLGSPADGGHWLPSWKSSLSIPWAVGVVLENDTLILRIGERG